MEFPNQKSNPVNLYRELRKDEVIIDYCAKEVKAKFREAVIDKGRCCWETLSIHELLKMLQDHQHKFFIRGMNNKRDAADLVAISMMILSKSEEGQFKYLDGIPLPQMSQPMPCPYGLDNASEKFDEECDAILRQLNKGDSILFAHHHHQKILDRTKIRTARKRDKSGEFSINGEQFSVAFEVALTMPAFNSLFLNGADKDTNELGFYTPEQFGFDSFGEMADFYNEYFNEGDIVFVHKISEVQNGR